MPLLASTSIKSLSLKILVAILVPMIVGFLNSRATVAAWESKPPSSVTIATTFFITGTRSGAVLPVTNIELGSISLFSSEDLDIELSMTLTLPVTFPW